MASPKSRVMTTKGPVPVVSVQPQPQTPQDPAPPTQAKTVETEILEVSAEKKRDDIIPIVMLEDIEPPPTVGFWKGVHELGIPKMEKNKVYKVPRHVAEVLLDTGRVALLE